MTVLLVLLLVAGIPVVLLVWSRRGNGGLDGTDPQGNRNIGRDGGPPSCGPSGDAGVGSGL
jgi:hypothetical protein